MSAPVTVDELRERLSQFGIYDYVVFFCAVVGCGAVGVYCAFRGSSGFGNVEEYLLGGRSLRSFPVAMSLTASFVSGLTIIGAPAESYLYGTEYMFAFISFFLAGIASSYLFLPVFHEMKVLSTFEYLQRRFDENVGLFGCLLFTITQVCWLPIVVYVPALAFNQVTGVDLRIVAPCVCSLCVLYTCWGGLRAVVWTDVFQIVLTISCMILLTAKGALDGGGFSEVWRTNQEGGRLPAPTFEWDFILSHDFWGVTFASLISFIHETVVNQNILQMYLSVPSLAHARRALWMFILATAALMLSVCFVGLILYSTYHDCDPLTTKLVTEREQLLPLLTAKITADLPGLCGLLTAGVFSASLSSFSAGLISTSGVVVQDFIRPLVGRGTGARVGNVVMRGVVLLLGGILLFVIIIMEKMDILLRVLVSLGSMTSGPMLGVFLSGIFLPWVNAKGALLGGILGLFGSGFLVIAIQNAIAQNKLKFVSKPTSVEACLYYYNASAILSVADSNNGDMFPLFKLSYFWHTACGAFITLTSVVLISALTGFTDIRRVNPVYFSPPIRSLLPLSKSRMENKKLLT